MFSIMMTVGGIAPMLSPLAGQLRVIAFIWLARRVLGPGDPELVIMVVGSLYLVHETLPTERRTQGGIKASRSRTQAAYCAIRPILGLHLRVCLLDGRDVRLHRSLALRLPEHSGTWDHRFLVGLCHSMPWDSPSPVCIAMKLVDPCGPAADDIHRRHWPHWSSAPGCWPSSHLVRPHSFRPWCWFSLHSASRWALSSGNATALATDQVKEHAGSGSAIIGALQFTLAAVASPLVGLAGENNAVPMALVMLAGGIIALLSMITLTRGAATTAGAGLQEVHPEAVPTP